MSGGEEALASDLIHTVSIVRYCNGELRSERDRIIREECLEIWAHKHYLTRTVCLPENDEWLALGWCHSMGLISSRSDVLAMHRSREGQITRLEMTFTPHVQDTLKIMRKKSGPAPTRYETGVSQVRAGSLLSVDSLFQASTMQKSGQVLFQATGGTHSAALFGPGLRLIAMAEDVGRHNALDKVIGQTLGEQLNNSVLLILSSRLNSEMVGKAVQAKIPFLAGISAPTQSGVELAEQSGMTLIGFLRPGRFNLYTHAWRLCPDS